MPRLTAVVGLGMAALLIAPQLYAEDGGRWLERMAEAVQEQSYHGSYVYERTGVFTTQDIWRQVDDGGARERLLQTAGRPQEWLRQDGQLVCTTSSDLKRSRSPGRTSPPMIDSEQLADFYSMKVYGETRIAKRPVTVVAVQPKDGFRYAHELYIDNETGLMLKSLLVDEQRELLERFQFAAISFDEPAYKAGLEPSSSCLEVAITEIPVDADMPFWEPAWLPPGFTLSHREVQTLRDSDALVTSQIYSDGLASFTLFVEPLGRDSLAEDLRAQLGPTVAVSRRLLTDDALFLATVVGEVPVRTAERIADALSEAVTGAAR